MLSTGNATTNTYPIPRMSLCPSHCKPLSVSCRHQVWSLPCERAHALPLSGVPASPSLSDNTTWFFKLHRCATLSVNSPHRAPCTEIGPPSSGHPGLPGCSHQGTLLTCAEFPLNRLEIELDGAAQDIKPRLQCHFL